MEGTCVLITICKIGNVDNVFLMMFQDGEEAHSREEADERVHGLGAGGQEEAGRPVPGIAQRRAQQDFRKAVEVRTIRQQTVVPLKAYLR